MTSAKKLRARPALEALENRLTPASYVNGNGDLIVAGSSANDTVVVSRVQVLGIHFYKVAENGVATYHLASKVWGGDVYFFGYAGDDYFRNDAALRAKAYGNEGDDALIGGSNHDHLDGGKGSDELWGDAGNDVLKAGYDYYQNKLYGGSGDDWLYGGNGRDFMHGRAGNDTMYGGWGNDWMWGGAGNDRMYGQVGDDTLFGGNGDDYLSGGPNVGDHGYGGFGNDTLAGFP